MVFLAVLTIPLAVAPELGRTHRQLASWLFALYAGPGLLGLWLAVRHRQPLVLTGNVFAIILIASVADQDTFSDLAGAAILAGAVVVVLGLTGLSGLLSRLVPPPIVVGVLAGAVLPFVVRLFNAMGQDPIVVGSAFVAYLAARARLRAVTPLLPALVGGIAAAVLTGHLGAPPTLEPPGLELTLPTFSLTTIVSITPVLVAITVLQANVPSMVFLRSQGYEPPAREIDVTSGVGTIALSLLGPTAVSIPLPIMPLVAGPQCGAWDRRFRVALAATIALVTIGVFGGVAASLVTWLPAALVLALAGLALAGVLAPALGQVTAGPLIWGPLFAFVVVQSNLTLVGLGSYFWALVIGVAVSAVVERDQLRAFNAVARPTAHGEPDPGPSATPSTERS